MPLIDAHRGRTTNRTHRNLGGVSLLFVYLIGLYELTEFSESLCSNDHGGTSRNALDLAVFRAISFGKLCTGLAISCRVLQPLFKGC